MKTYNEILQQGIKSEVLERFIRYVKIDTGSDRHMETTPTTVCQWDLARILEKELKDLGISDLYFNDMMYMIARVPASKGYENKPTIGFMAHMDTASDVTGKNVQPRVVENYDGKDVVLSKEYTLSPKDFQDLSDHIGDTLIVTDGHTLLGADDKAGVAEIMTALSFLKNNPSVMHGPLEIVFTPDEETGKGMDKFPLEQLKAKACYTIDGGKLGEVEAECFNAWRVLVKFTGKAIHIGSARGKFANATAMACSFVSMLPRSEAPESTDGWYGYYCPLEIKGELEKAELEMYLRDFSMEGMNARIEAVKVFAKAIEAQYPLGSVEVKFEKQYLNMREELDKRPEVLANAIEGAKRAGVVPFVAPIRGGTDGARLTEKGIPTPNLFTGGHNYHSRYEWASLSNMIQAVDTIIEITKLWAEK